MTFIKVLFLGSVTLLAVSVSAQNNDGALAHAGDSAR
jgi:hypothetical protein